MGEIYRQAKGTFACLVSSASVGSVLLTACDTLDDRHVAAVKTLYGTPLPSDWNTTAMEASTNVITDWTELSAIGTNSIQSLTATEHAALKVAALSIASDHHWTRAWIVQEWLLSADPSTLTGSHRLQWRSYFAIFLATCFSIRDVLPGRHENRPAREEGTPRDLFLQILSERFGNARKSDIQITIAKFRTSQCFDVRDHVYAFLAVIKWEFLSEDVVPDYRISNFDLAMQIAPEVLCFRKASGEIAVPPNAPLHVEGVLDMLEVNVDDPAVKAMIGSRRAVPYHKDTPFARSIALKLSRYPFASQRTTRLRRRGDSTFQTLLEMAEPPDLVAEPIIGSHTFDDRLSSYLSSPHDTGDRAPSPLVHAYSTVGMLCPDAKDGDCLVEICKDGGPPENGPVISSSPYMTCYFVVRQQSGNEPIYAIVGQAILRNDLVTCDGCVHCSIMPQEPSFAEEVPQLSVAFSLKDLMVLVAQDLVHHQDHDRFRHYARRTGTGVCGDSWSSFAFTGDIS